MLRWIEFAAGFYYLIFGIDGFLKKIPLPRPSDKALRLLIALDETKYILFSVKIIEIMVGMAWISGYAGGLAWLLMSPVLFNILAYHIFLNRKEVVLPLVLAATHLIIAYRYRYFLIDIFYLGVQ